MRFCPQCLWPAADIGDVREKKKRKRIEFFSLFSSSLSLNFLESNSGHNVPIILFFLFWPEFSRKLTHRNKTWTATQMNLFSFILWAGKSYVIENLRVPIFYHFLCVTGPILCFYLDWSKERKEFGDQSRIAQ